jgi:hypothetical protein
MKTNSDISHPYEIPSYPNIDTTNVDNIENACRCNDSLTENDSILMIAQQTKKTLAVYGLTQQDIWCHHVFIKEYTQEKSPEKFPSIIFQRLQELVPCGLEPTGHVFNLNGETYWVASLISTSLKLCPIETELNSHNCYGLYRGDRDFWFVKSSTLEVLRVQDLVPYQIGFFGFNHSSTSQDYIDLNKYVRFFYLHCGKIPKELITKTIPVWSLTTTTPLPQANRQVIDSFKLFGCKFSLCRDQDSQQDKDSSPTMTTGIVTETVTTIDYSSLPIDFQPSPLPNLKGSYLVIETSENNGLHFLDVISSHLSNTCRYLEVYDRRLKIPSHQNCTLVGEYRPQPYMILANVDDYLLLPPFYEIKKYSRILLC